MNAKPNRFRIKGTTNKIFWDFVVFGFKDMQKPKTGNVFVGFAKLYLGSVISISDWGVWYNGDRKELWIGLPAKKTKDGSYINIVWIPKKLQTSIQNKLNNKHWRWGKRLPKPVELNQISLFDWEKNEDVLVESFLKDFKVESEKITDDDREGVYIYE